MRFLTDQDYDVLIRTEIKEILLENYWEYPERQQAENHKLLRAEDMAVAQIKNYISGRYDCKAIFSAQGGARNAFIVMITIDCALYHLYCSLAPNKIPKHRSERYADALEWLKAIQANTGISADLPPIEDENGEIKDAFRLTSKYKSQNNKW